MASTSIPCLLFLSLLCYSMILTKCEVDEGDLLKDMNQYRKFYNLTALNRTKSADCVADGIVGMFMNQTCTNTSTVPNNTTLTLSNYTILVAKCGLNASGDSLVLAACGPALVASNISATYATSLDAVRFPKVGIDSQGNWTVVVLVANATLVNGASAALAFTAIAHLYPLFSFLCFLVLV